MTHSEPGSVQFQRPTGVADLLMAAQTSKMTAMQLSQVMLRPEPSLRRRAP